VNYVNPLPSFYGQKSLDKITKPVKEFEQAFKEYMVHSSQISQAIRNTDIVFRDNKRKQLLVDTATQYIK
jgi:uncharacterized protein YeeX (DUF496 family)